MSELSQRVTNAEPKKYGKILTSIVDNAQHLQSPAIASYVRKLRKDHPDETPAQIIERIQKNYLKIITASGGAVGATAAFPGVGTIASFGAIGAESLMFIEAGAFMALAMAEVHGVPIDNRDLRLTLVLSVAIGDSALALVRSTLGKKSELKNAASGSPDQLFKLGKVNQQLLSMFTRRFLAKRLPLLFGKVMPLGLGAIAGTVGNRAMGKRVIANANEIFGEAPASFTAAPGAGT